jgi:hypothetical protein
MSQGDLIDLSPATHMILCPHCAKQTPHQSPGNVILFANAKCVQCGRDFVIAMDKPSP